MANQLYDEFDVVLIQSPTGGVNTSIRLVRPISDDFNFGQANTRSDFGLSKPSLRLHARRCKAVARGLSLNGTFGAMSGNRRDGAAADWLT
jgi:hypothetical protein